MYVDGTESCQPPYQVTQNYLYLKEVWLVFPPQLAGGIPKWSHPSTVSRNKRNTVSESFAHLVQPAGAAPEIGW
jgi:hypothetical protein